LNILFGQNGVFSAKHLTFAQTLSHTLTCESTGTRKRKIRKN